jgi:hypothetical protein
MRYETRKIIDKRIDKHLQHLNPSIQCIYSPLYLLHSFDKVLVIPLYLDVRTEASSYHSTTVNFRNLFPRRKLNFFFRFSFFRLRCEHS